MLLFHVLAGAWAVLGLAFFPKCTLDDAYIYYHFVYLRDNLVWRLRDDPEASAPAAADR